MPALSPIQAFSGILNLLIANARLAKGDMLDPQPRSASQEDLDHQPLLNFNGDSCFDTAGVGFIVIEFENGWQCEFPITNPGLSATHNFAAGRDARDRLWNSNAYSRRG
ncbi:hypothetical protein HJFPF1_04197 [Paramyrothecium foliicola]|nr:hypothetical protein HJFPF1_04197 [Paramyrothecium foliicola]